MRRRVAVQRGQERDPQHRRGVRQVQRDRGRCPQRLLGRVRPEPDGERRSLGAVPVGDGHRDQRRQRDEVRVRSVRRCGVLLPHRGEQRARPERRPGRLITGTR